MLNDVILRFILADMGLPLIFLELPFMVAALIVVVAIEFFVLRKLQIKFLDVLITNFVSTIIGIPVAYLFRFMVVWIPGKFGINYGTLDALVVLGKYSSKPNILLAFVVVFLIDLMFSILIEYALLRRWYAHEDSLRSATIRANVISYAALAVATIVLMAISSAF